MLSPLPPVPLDDPQRNEANMLLMRMKESPDMWTQAGSILEQSQSQHTRFIGLQVRPSDLVDPCSIDTTESSNEAVARYLRPILQCGHLLPQLASSSRLFYGLARRAAGSRRGGLSGLPVGNALASIGVLSLARDTYE